MGYPRAGFIWLCILILIFPPDPDLFWFRGGFHMHLMCQGTAYRDAVLPGVIFTFIVDHDHSLLLSRVIAGASHSLGFSPVLSRARRTGRP